MKPKLFDNNTNADFLIESAIMWKEHKTRVIDLSVMMENELDSKNTRLADMPNSTQLSVKREPVKIGTTTSLEG